MIYLEVKAHLTSMATTAFCSDTLFPSGLHLGGLSFVFQQDNDQKHISRLCNGYLTKENDGVLYQCYIYSCSSPPAFDFTGFLTTSAGNHHHAHLVFIILRTWYSSLRAPGLHYFTHYLPFIWHSLRFFPQAVLFSVVHV